MSNYSLSLSSSRSWLSSLFDTDDNDDDDDGGDNDDDDDDEEEDDEEDDDDDDAQLCFVLKYFWLVFSPGKESCRKPQPPRALQAANNK